jgi:hypothetical protein
MIEAVIQKFVDGIAVKDTGVYAREAISYGKRGVRGLEVYIADDSQRSLFSILRYSPAGVLILGPGLSCSA